MSFETVFRHLPRLALARLLVVGLRQRIEHSGGAEPRAERRGERGSGTVEWLGISALSIGLLVGLFAGLEQIGEAVLSAIRASLGF